MQKKEERGCYHQADSEAHLCTRACVYVCVCASALPDMEDFE